MKNTENETFFRDPAYQETKQHTDTMFAYNVYPCTIPTDFTFVPLHWQDSVEIIYVKKGTGLVQTDFETHTAEAGDVFLILPGHLHGIRNIRNIRMEYENIIFDLNFLGSDSVDLCSQKYLQPLLNGSIQLPSHIERTDPLYPSILACLDASDRLCSLRPNGYELGVKGNLMILFSLLFQLSAAQPEKSPDVKNLRKIKTVLSRIEQDYSKKLTVEDLANECGYSVSHFMRWFKSVTGSSFSAYLIEYRLSKAALDLRSTDDTILEIAGRNGFENLSNFNRLFKKRFEMTPREFREKVL